MNTPIERLQTALETLGLKAVEARLENLLEQASKKEASYADFLDELLNSNGTAKYLTNSFTAGSHSLVAVFNSTNPDFAGSTSSTLTQYVSDFTVAVSPSSLTLARGTSGTYSLTVTPVGEFSGTMSLSCGGAPGGTTCAISPTQVTQSGSGSAQATVTINAAQNASKGTHTLTFTGTSGGLNHKVTASLTID
jgi:hypothetical protein